ncbi:MAG: NAD(P)-binding domain-containing protein [Planctomycetaceae bacterium]|nr:NAD(P)-binding domain-containing protein [Planctomycetaceae bacterium]
MSTSLPTQPPERSGSGHPSPAPSAYFATVPPQEILPIVNGRYESSVPGIYIIGDVTGLPLVKVAANQGVEVIQKMQDGKAFERPADDDGRLDLVIIGGGPAGLSAAIEAQKLGLTYVVLERNRIASTVRSFPPGKKVYAEPQFVDNTSELDVSEDLDRDDFLDRVQRLVTDRAVKIKEDTEVKHVRKSGERDFHTETADGKVFPSRYVLVAIGRQGQPRLLDCPGADDAHKVTYRLHSPEDYGNSKVLVVGGGNSAIEAALLLKDGNDVTLSYRGDNFFRAKDANQKLLAEAEASQQINVVRNSNVTAIRQTDVDLDVDGTTTTIDNDFVVVQIGTLPPVPFLMDLGVELDGIWTLRRLLQAVVGLCVGFVVYFGAKFFVLREAAAGTGKLLVPGLTALKDGRLLATAGSAVQLVAPYAIAALGAIWLINVQLRARGRKTLPVTHPLRWLTLTAIALWFVKYASAFLTLDPTQAGAGPYHLPGFEWLFAVIPTYFTNLYGFYYLLYFSAITSFGLYWAFRTKNAIIWKRNLTIIATQWTLWWGIPTFLVVFNGRNVWTPVASKLINAWPLNMTAFRVDPVVGQGDPTWWHSVAVFGVVWAVFLTFVLIPLFTIRWGKIYCSYVCSCGALAETVGNAYRHRGPKGDTPRRWERIGFVFIGLASAATIADLMGFRQLFDWYNIYVGAGMAGAIAIGLYPFLGQRIWCRMWCPLAFWMNFWGRWSKFRITPEKGKCIDCNVCNQYCQMGIDIKTRALQGEPITLESTPCIGCAECVVRCPMEILHLGEAPDATLVPLNIPDTMTQSW